ncbi:MAG TPA: hypothetical protein VHY08_10375 [Bacillota bacterium]|nr:hypothetical protein [Bacillota bacterium]
MSLIKWNFNGLIIQKLNDLNNVCPLTSYMGLERYQSWPLEDRTDEQSKKLTEETEERWFNYFYGESNEKYALAVVPSMEYISRYLNTCKNYNLKVRVLHIETEREEPQWEGPPLDKTFLGYEYATSQNFYSPLSDDLFGLSTPPSLVNSKSVLNKYGLFNTEEDLISYIENRNKAIGEGYDLESFGDFCKYKVSLITDTII